MITDITDHLACLSIVASPDILLKGYRYVTRRQITEENSKKLINKITETQNVLSSHVTNTHQPSLEQKYDDYFFHLSKIYNDCFTICTKKVHVKTLCKPWIAPAIQSLINKKNILFSKKSKNKTSDNISKYNDAKEKMDKAIEKGKEKYNKSLLDNTDNSTRKKWDAIRTIINRKKINQNYCPIPVFLYS